MLVMLTIFIMVIQYDIGYSLEEFYTIKVFIAYNVY